MHLSSLIVETTVLINPQVGSKWELIEHMAAAIYASRSDWALPFEAVLERIHRRERQITTGLERGVALPHGLLDPGSTTSAAFAVLPGGLDFESLDGQPAQFVLLMVFPDDPQGRQMHLELLGRSVKLFCDPELRASLLGLQDANQVLSRLHQAEARLFP